MTTLVHVPVLAEFEPIYAQMGGLGWSPADVDGMETWQVGRFLGSAEHGLDPVIRGSRGLRVPTDGDDDGPGKGRGAKIGGGASLRRRLANRGREMGQLIKGGGR